MYVHVDVEIIHVASLASQLAPGTDFQVLGFLVDQPHLASIYMSTEDVNSSPPAGMADTLLTEASWHP